MDAIKKRISSRNFLDKPIPDELINEMLEAARLAPSGGNNQNWFFGIIKETELKIKLAKAAGNQMWIASAPVIFALCADISSDLKNQPDDDFGVTVNYTRFGKEFIKYMNDCPERKSVNKLFANATPLISGEHMFLTAVSHGLSACFIGYLNTDKADEVLQLPENISCLFLLPVGYTAEQLDYPTKKTVDEISFTNIWKNDKS